MTIKFLTIRLQVHVSLMVRPTTFCWAPRTTNLALFFMMVPSDRLFRLNTHVVPTISAIFIVAIAHKTLWKLCLLRRAPISSSMALNHNSCSSLSSIPKSLLKSW
jgi:hypothetical protein